MARRYQNKIKKQIKDYIIPIIIVFIVSILFLNYIFNSDKNNNNSEVNINDYVTVNYISPESETFVIYQGGKKTKIENTLNVYSGEKIIVMEQGHIDIEIIDQGGKLSLNRRGEIQVLGKNKFSLISSDLWVNTNNQIDIEMRYADISANGNSVFSLSQNEAASTIYVLSGNVDVKAPNGSSTTLQSGEKLEIMRNNANNKSFDISLNKRDLDDYTKNNDEWYTKNNGNFYLLQSNNSQKDTSSKPLNINQGYIDFSNIYDEGTVTTDSINIEGYIADEVVDKININGKDAEIDREKKQFIIKDFKITSRINDLVYKIYDDKGSILSKGVITLHYPSGAISSNQTSGLATANTYTLQSSEEYKIVSPATNPFTTTDSVIRVEGYVPNKTVSKIIINGYQLQRFVSYSNYWYYFANSEFGNLKEGVNIYNIQYYGEGDKIIYENNFVIIKE